MKNLFNTVKMSKPKRSVFDLSHDVKLSLNMGDLIPICLMEALPGDKFNISCESLIRFAPLIAPVMHRMDVTMHYFFCPNRILWPGWEKFITNTKDDGTGQLPAFPFIRMNDANWLLGGLADYLGIPDPTGTSNIEEKINALPFFAYGKIWNEYYRDQNNVDGEDWEASDGDNTSLGQLYNIRKRAWEHDYFTSALPFAQKGDAVTLPIGQVGDVPVYLNDDSTVLTGSPISPTVAGDVADPALPTHTLFANTSELEIGSTTINDLRRAYRLQEWLEKAARGGTRYVESILSHFGIKSPDARLQRPEYITGMKSPVVISEVLNTAGSFSGDDPTSPPQGNMSGHAISVTQGKYGSYFCQEHGYIMGIMSVTPNTAYQNGIAKHFLKIDDPTQYAFPSFANLGEQEILNREIFAYESVGGNTFGYVPRYAEYKFMGSRVAGDFRSALDYWHLGRKFDGTPALNEDFIQCNPDPRIFAVEDPTVQKLYAHVFNKIRAVRPLPKFGTPTF